MIVILGLCVEMTCRVVAVGQAKMSAVGKTRSCASPLLALGGKSPLSLLDTESGSAAVINILGRIEYGVYV